MNPVTNRNTVEWLRAMRELEIAEDFDNVFLTDDDKTEYELSDPRYLECLLEDDMEAE